LATINGERQQVVSRITHLVALLDSVQNRLAATRRQLSALSQKDSGLIAQVAQLEQNISDMQAQATAERTALQRQIDDQRVQIVALTGKVDTLTQNKTQLTSEVSDLTVEKNTAYYVIGTKDELIKKGVLVAEGSKRFLLLGGRQVSPARELDPSSFTRIDRRESRTISLPEGEYKILSRQSPTYTGAKDAKDGKIAGSLVIDQPEEFWAPSRFLILVRS
jgi:cell division protein FtsB